MMTVCGFAWLFLIYAESVHSVCLMAVDIEPKVGSVM